VVPYGVAKMGGRIKPAVRQTLNFALNPYEGVGPVQNIAEWIDLDHYAMEFTASSSSARAGAGFFESGFVSETQMETLWIGCFRSSRHTFKSTERRSLGMAMCKPYAPTIPGTAEEVT
jgi:hypothetical protein